MNYSDINKEMVIESSRSEDKDKIMTAIVIQHNFIENHSTTDEVPSERAGVNLELGENRWLNLIKLSVL